MREYRFKIVDYCENYGKVGYAKNRREALRIAAHHSKSCDGDCDIWILPINPATGLYKRSWAIKY